MRLGIAALIAGYVLTCCWGIRNGFTIRSG